MKKYISVLLCAVLLFSQTLLTVRSAEIFYINATPPVIEEISTTGENENTSYELQFTSCLEEAEAVRSATADAVAEMLGGTQALLASRYSYLTVSTLNVLEVSTDKESWFTLGTTKNTEGSFYISVKNDIIPALKDGGADISPVAEGEEFFMRLLTVSESYKDENLKSIFIHTVSEPFSVTSSPFGYINYILPAGALNPQSNISFFSLPLNEDMPLASPERKGYIFDGWSYEGDSRTGKIPAGSHYIELVSHWLPMEYEINYVLTTDLSYHFGKADMTNMPDYYTVGEGAVISDIRSPVTGYNFDGWYYEKDFSGERVREITPEDTGVKLLYAKWVKDETIVADKEKERLEFIEKNKFGDVNDDGKISAADARLILRAVVGLETLSEEMLKRADFRGTGKILSADARTILRISVGLDDLYTILSENGVLP